MYAGRRLHVEIAQEEADSVERLEFESGRLGLRGAVDVLRTRSGELIPYEHQGFNNGEPEPYELGHALNTWLAANNDINGTWNGWGLYAWSRPCAAPDDVENPVLQATFSPDGKRLATSDMHGQLFVWPVVARSLQ